ncbi:MAG TPA: MipA/OmpV family protein [Croceibacterium sp.]|nr:MipA/OmpV family protein [Croceibacterium sp.]
MEQGAINLTFLAFRRRAAFAAGAGAVALAWPAAAQQAQPEAKEPYRYRVAAGAQWTPRYPGAEDLQPSVMPNFDRARGDTPFKFEAPDDGFGIEIVNSNGFAFGPVGNFEDKRTAEDVGTALPDVDFSIELGGVVKYELGERFRLRGELRKGLTGHKGWIGNAGADLIFRDKDRWLVSFGPRVTWSDNKYQDAWFSVAPADSAPSGLPAFDAGGGLQAYGATASFLTQFSKHWGLSAYAKYDRLTGDAADSPIVLTYGSRDQFSFGAALTYTFGRGVN